MDIQFALALILATLILGILFLIILCCRSMGRIPKMPRISKTTLWNIFPYILILYFLVLGLLVPSLLYLTLPSAIASVFGIILGFWLNESSRLKRRKEDAKQLLKAIKGELEHNLAIASSMENDIETVEVAFQTFKTNLWESFSSRLEVLENFQLLIDLSILYHRLHDVANAIRYNRKELEEKGAEEVLTYVFEEEPLEGLKHLKAQISKLVTAIDAEVMKT